MKLAARSSPRRRAASTSMPGFGLRHSQSSASSWGQTTISSRGSAARRTSLMRSTASSVRVPRATSGWFVTTTRSNPAARSLAQASPTPGSSSTSLASPGGYGRPSRTTTAFRTPSRSRKTAGRAMSGSGRPRLVEQRPQRVLQRLTRGAPVLPPESANPLRVQAHDRHVAAPAALSARVLVVDLRSAETNRLDGKVGDLGDRQVVARRDVERLVVPCRVAMGRQNGVDDIVDVDVRLALPAVPEDRQLRSVLEQPADEVEADAVRLPRPDDVAEAEDQPREPEHEAVGGDERLASELARAVGRDRHERSPVLVDLELAEVAVDAAPRGVEDAGGLRLAHGLEDVMREPRALVEVDRGLGHGACDVRVRREVDDDVVVRHLCRQRAEILDVAAHDAQVLVARMVL